MKRELAEITCLACGRALGEVERTDSHVRLIPAPESPSSAQLLRKDGTGMICGRCGGRAYMGPMQRMVNYAA